MLKGKLESYLDCLDFNRSSLNKLLDGDEKSLQRNLKLTQKNLAKMTDEFKLMLAQQEVLLA